MFAATLLFPRGAGQDGERRSRLAYSARSTARDVRRRFTL